MATVELELIQPYERMYQTVCSCGWAGKTWYLTTNANAEGIRHIRGEHGGDDQ